MGKKDIFIALGQALFAVFGSCVKWLNAKEKETQRVFTLIIEAVSASFSGFLVYCIYEWLGLNVFISFAIAGIIGNQGAKGIDVLGKFIINHSVFKPAKEPDDAEPDEES